MSKSFKRFLYIIIGSISFCFGTLGIYLPVLPTVPRYLSAGGLTVLHKVLLIAFVSVQLGIVAFLLRSSMILVAVIAVLYICFLASILFAVKTVSLK